MIGTEVFCIDDTIPNKAIFEGYREWVRGNVVYTVRDSITNCSGQIIGLLLMEVANPKLLLTESGRYREPSFSVTRFKFLPKDPFLRNKILFNQFPKLN